MTILVTGGRGAVARGLTALLRDQGRDVRVASREPEAPDVVRCDLSDPATFPAALDGADSVFLYAAADTADAFAAAAVAAGVEHIVLLSSSAVLGPDAGSDRLAGAHLAVEKVLTAAPVRTTLLRPGSFAGNALAWAGPIRAGTPISLPFPGSHSDPIHELDVAECALAALTDPGAAGRAHHLTGPESMTFAAQIDALARATGRAIPVEHVTREEWKAGVAEYLPAAFADSLLDWWRSNDGRPVETTSTVRELTGHPARPFTTWAADHAADFGAGTD